MLQHIITFALSLQLVFSQEVGSSCRQNDGSQGRCELFRNCQTASEQLRRGNMPVTCGFRGKEPIVCCEKSQRQTESISVQQCQRYSTLFGSRAGFDPQFVIGGRRSNPLEFKHMAALGYGDRDNIRWNCGGTLISEEYVLTAAHCLSSRQLGSVKWVRLGDLDLNRTDDDASPQDFKVDSVVRHPQYKLPFKYNDIALIRLDRKAQFSTYVLPACLHDTFDLETDKLTATGWGTLEYNGHKSNMLMKVDLDVFSEQSCASIYKQDRTIPNGIQFQSQLCAGGKDGIRDTCEGDSGGPLFMRMRQPRGMHQLVGVTSFGKPCGNINVPGVYTRVSYFVPWIEKIVWP